MFAIQDVLEISPAHKAIDHIRNLPLAGWVARTQHDIMWIYQKVPPDHVFTNYVAA